MRARKPLRVQVQECVESWALERKLEARDGNIESFEIYIDMLLTNYGVVETREEAFPWLKEVMENDFLKILNHEALVLCSSHSCSYCRAKRKLSRLLN